LPVKLILIAEGSVHVWTGRCVIAFLRQRSRFISWPTTRQRNDIRFSFKEEFGIPHCISIIDGFHVNLATAPARDDAGAFHSRKEIRRGTATTFSGW